MGEQIINDLWSFYGISAIFMILFILDWVDKRKQEKEDKKKHEKEKKETNDILNALAKSNDNIANSLLLLKASVEVNTTEFRQHDERAVREFGNIKEKLVRIETKKGVSNG